MGATLLLHRSAPPPLLSVFLHQSVKRTMTRFLSLLLLLLFLLVEPAVVGSTTIQYKGSVYSSVDVDQLRRGGNTFSIQVSVSAFPENRVQLERILVDALCTNIRFLDENGTVLFTPPPFSKPEIGQADLSPGAPLSEGLSTSELRAAFVDVLSRSDIRTDDSGRAVYVTFAGTNMNVFGDADAVLIVPCLPFFIFEQIERVGVQDLPHNCLAGDPFLFRKKPFLTLAATPASPRDDFFVTGRLISIPLNFTEMPAIQAKPILERNLRVMEGYTCLHSRQAFVRGSSWNGHTGTYSFTPSRGGIQTLCYTPYPEKLPLLKIKVFDSYSVAGPEGVSTDPPQIRVGLEFAGTIYGTNLTEHDTAVITDELCTDFLTQNVFFAELQYSSPSRVSFYGTFHKKGIYHVCYHREGSPAYIRASTLLVDKGSEVYIDVDSPNVLVDQEVKLVQSASVARLKVQDKGNLDLRKRSLNVSHFVWSGGTISGKGSINCTGYCKITTQGYETRELTVPLSNFGDMTFDVQRLYMDRDGSLYNYGNLTMAVSSMGEDGISSVLSNVRRNIIQNNGGGVFRLLALDNRSFALLTSRLELLNGTALISGRIHATDVMSRFDATTILKTGTELTLLNCHLGGTIHLEAHSTMVLGEGCHLAAANVTGHGTLRVNGENVMIDSITVDDHVTVILGSSSAEQPVSIGVYGTSSFESSTFVVTANVDFVTTTGLVKFLFNGGWVVEEATTSFAGNIIIQSASTTLVYGDSKATASSQKPLTTSVFVAPNSTMYCIDTHGLQLPELPLARPATAAVAAFAEEAEVEGGGEGRQKDAVALPRGSPHPSTFSSSCGLQYLSASDFIVVSGRVLLTGCWSFSTGGAISGPLEKLEAQSDWDFMLRDICPRMPPNVLPFVHTLCRHAVIPVVPFTCFSFTRELYLRSPAYLYADGVELVNGLLRATDAMTIKASRYVHIYENAQMEFLSGVLIMSPMTRVDGLLDLRSPPNSRIQGRLNISAAGRVLLNSAEPVVPALLSIVGDGVYAGADLQRVTKDSNATLWNIVDSTKGGPHDANYTNTENSFEAMRAYHMNHLPQSLECPEDIIYAMEKHRMYYEDFFGPISYSPSPDIPRASEMLTALVVSGAVSFLVFTLQLRFTRNTVRGWLEDMKIPCPLRLTLTWSEFSYRSLNYIGLCTAVLSNINNALAAFHPGLPVPLPFVRFLCLRSTRIIMPHHHLTADRLNQFAYMIIGISAVTAALAWKQGSLKYLKGRASVVVNVMTTSCSLATKVIFLFQIPILSMMLDGISCNTILRGEGSCHLFVSAYTMVLCAAAYFSTTIVVPWCICAEMYTTAPVDLHLKVNWLIFITFTQTTEIATWKIFYNSPLSQVLACLVFQVVRVMLAHVSPPTAYQNINQFLLSISLMPIMIYLSILFYLAVLKLGYVRSCTDYEWFFQTVFSLCVLLFAVLFWLRIVKTPMESEGSGDVKIDAIRRSIEQIRSRIRDLNMNIMNIFDSIERENTLNAIARLRIECLEKQERYRYETYKVLKRFIFGNRIVDMERDVHSPLSPTIPHVSSELSFGSAPASPTTSGPSSQNLLTVEEMESFSCGPALGKGSYGTVHLGMLTNGKLVAVKYINVALQTAEALAAVKAEVNMLRELCHPNIIRYYGAHTIEETMLVFMEFAVGGSLTSIAHKFTALTEPVMQLYTYQILLGLQYLHSKGVVHRDIKGENILVDGYGVAKLADFGCSKSLANLANPSEVGCATLVGSPFWMAPEVIRSESYGTKADIWSVGCTVVEMLNGGEPPWRQEFDNVYSAMFYVGSTNDIPQIPEETSELCRDFLFRCFERDVAKRATADELLQHPWIQSVSSPSARSGSRISSRQNTDVQFAEPDSSSAFHLKKAQ